MKDLIAPRESAGRRSPLRYAIQPDEIDRVFSAVGQHLREGKSGVAEELLSETIASFQLRPDDLANLKRLLSFTYETLGRYGESLETLAPYESGELSQKLNLETQVRVSTQLAIAHNNANDHPKAATLLKATRQTAIDANLTHLTGGIDIGLARVYRKLNECAICRDHAEQSLGCFREYGNWLGMAEAYREIALSHHQEGSSEKALEYFELGIKIIGDRAAPFMLAKLYTDMSGAYWFLRRPHDGIACLEKSIEFFDRTEHILTSVIAYNNLGINLILIGEWRRAEEMLARALERAVRTNHVHIAGILDSMAELNILRGNLPEARRRLDEAVEVARRQKREWYAAQAMRNLARCYLAQNKLDDAVATARETIELSQQIGDKHHGNMAGLVLAETYVCQSRLGEAENYLQIIEESDPSSDFFVLGNIQRIRGLAAVERGDSEMAVHHFDRSLTIFEAAADVYHTGLAHYLIGTTLDAARAPRAIKHLTRAAEIFRKLELSPMAAAAAEKLAALRAGAADKGPAPRSNSVVSQLLMVRLAEATASRELLFRELAAILQQESRARRLIIAETDDGRELRAFIAHGYSPIDGADLVRKFDAARRDGDEKAFADRKGIAVLPLKPAHAKPALLFVQPKAGAVLNDGSPFGPLLRVVELAMDVISLRQKDKSQPADEEAAAYPSNSLMPGFIHSSPAMTALIEEVYKIRSSDVTVLVTGESGTGKELVSRGIHLLSNRKDKVFVPFNCTAVPRELAEGHLFGYRRGAFTGAVSDSPGMIRAADGGTLFLDEIGDLSLDAQPKLLRFLQEGEVQPIGERKPIKVDVRVIAATNMPLEEKVANGTFREDLYYRLNVIRLRVPPLRERRSEIPPIINYYVNHYSARFGKKGVTLTPQTIDLLTVCEWEGNVRQLCNEIQRVVARAVDNEVVTPDHLSPELRRVARPLGGGISSFPDVSAGGNVRPMISSFESISSGSANAAGPPPTGTLEAAVTNLEIQMISDALDRHAGNISRVAAELGLTRRGLYLKIERYGIERAAA